MECQLDFFIDDKSDFDYIREEVEAIRVSGDKVRKGMYAKHAELEKCYRELNERLAVIERNICKGDE